MNVPMRVDEVFGSAAREAGDAVQLLLADGTEITYAQTHARAARLAGALVSAGLRKDDRVAGLMRNSREIVEFYIACGLAGVIGVAINAMSTEREIDRILADCGA
ncbi:MAG TPA: AMP-binding protein, partial [Zeimonas sp.]